MAADQDRINVVADLLLGAAYADEHFAGREKDKIKELLGELLEDDELPEGLVARIDYFDPEAFDLKETAADFADDPPIKKRKLLELVAAVHEADEELDVSEDDYLRALASAIGAGLQDYSDLVLEYEVEDLRESLEELRGGADDDEPFADDEELAAAFADEDEDEDLGDDDEEDDEDDDLGDEEDDEEEEK